MGDGDTLLNAIIGGIAAFVLSFVPLSPVLGGAIAGYLQGGTRNDGIRVGALSGVVAAVPLVLGGVFFFLVASFAVPFGEPGAGFGIVAFLLFLVFALVIGGLYTVGLGAVGGWLGNYVRYDTDLLEDREPLEVQR